MNNPERGDEGLMNNPGERGDDGSDLMNNSEVMRCESGFEKRSWREEMWVRF